jgi:hypothetical protein
MKNDINPRKDLGRRRPNLGLPSKGSDIPEDGTGAARVSTQHHGSSELVNQPATNQSCRSCDECLHRKLLTATIAPP